MIDFGVNFEGFTDDQRYNIAFDLSFDKNPSHNDQPFIEYLNNFKNPDIALSNEQLLHNSYEELFDLISIFGIGILIFPSLILSLGG